MLWLRGRFLSRRELWERKINVPQKVAILKRAGIVMPPLPSSKTFLLGNQRVGLCVGDSDSLFDYRTAMFAWRQAINGLYRAFRGTSASATRYGSGLSMW